MEKRSTKIAYFVALGIFIVLLVILGLQFKGKENPVFVGGGAFYTTGDGVFLDGILKTADDSEGSKYALDGSYYVSPEAGTYFELSEDGNTIVGADGTEYVKSETPSKDVNGVEYTTYEEQVYSETPFAGTFWCDSPVRRHFLVSAAPHRGHRAGPDQQGSVFFPVPGLPGRRAAVHPVRSLGHHRDPGGCRLRYHLRAG